MTPSPIPIPLPVSLGPHEADWWLVALTGLGVLVTALIAFLTLRANLRANAAQEIATKAYTEAIKASHEASERQVAALEAMAQRLNAGQTTEETPPTDVRWSLERDVGKNRWILRNLGTATAFEAQLRGVTDDDARDLHVFHEEAIDVPPNAYISFAIWRSLASPPATVVEVIWRDDLRAAHSTRLVVV